jgi:hypothetical protein
MIAVCTEAEPLTKTADLFPEEPDENEVGAGQKPEEDGVTAIPDGKLLDYITGKLIKDV